MVIDDKILAACLIAAKKSDGRPLLASVKLDSYKAVATDGFKLIAIDMPLQVNPTEYPNTGNEYLVADEAIVPAEDLKRALSLIPKKASLPIFERAITAKGSDDSHVKVVTTNLETTNAIDIEKVSGEFPDYKRVLKGVTDRKDAKYVKVNAKYLVELLEAFIKGGAEHVTLEIDDPLAPIKVEGEIAHEPSRNIVGLVMPMRT